MRRFERAVLACEMGDFATGGLGVEAFDVALFTDLVAGFDVNFEEVVAEQAAGEVAEFAARSDGGDEGDDALGNEDFGDFRNAAAFGWSPLIETEFLSIWMLLTMSAISG